MLYKKPHASPPGIFSGHRHPKGVPFLETFLGDQSFHHSSRSALLISGFVTLPTFQRGKKEVNFKGRGGGIPLLHSIR